MPAYLLGEDIAFPDPDRATPEGVVAVGGDLRPERLLLAYRMGIFPWPVEGYPLLWFSPNPRFVLPLDAPAEQVHLGRSLRKSLRRARYRLTLDTAFSDVVEACSSVPRPGQDGTWITDEVREGYRDLHDLGFAHSVEAWEGERLVGGVYGVSLGRVFFGESMFASAPDASKVAFATLLATLVGWGFRMVDCQVETEHLARFGAENWSRGRFLHELEQALAAPTREGKWRLDTTPAEVVARLTQPKSAS